MDIDVVLSPAFSDRESLKGRRVVVVDVLRASTTIATALASGARAIIPATDTGEAGRLAATLDSEFSLLGGERDGKMIAGFGAGNSPTEYGPEAVDRKTIVLTTTNGTRALDRAKLAAHVAVGAFVNATPAARFLKEGLASGEPGTVLCAGWTGRVSLEDTLCAGLIVSLIVPPEAASRLTDSAKMAYALYMGSRDDLPRAIRGTDHAQRLDALGLSSDVALCSQIDTLDVLPIQHDGRITLNPPSA